MGSFAVTSIDGFVIESTKNYFDEWFFKPSDRKVATVKRSTLRRFWSFEEGNDDEVETRYVYEITAKRLRRRLELAGFTLSMAEQEFKECIDARLAKIDEFRTITERFDYRDHVKVFEKAAFRDWLLKLREFVSTNLRFAHDFEEPIINSDPVLELLQNVPHYQSWSDDFALRYHETVNWPAKHVECLARCVLEVVDPDAICQLDITDLVEGGYTDSFDDVLEFESTNTRSLSVFNNGIDDIRNLMALAPGNEVLQQLLFANVITAMETYFGDTLRKQISRRQALLRRFVETSPELKDKKFSLGRVFEQYDSILGQVMEILNRTSFHNIELVKNIYCSVFAVHLDGLPFDVLEEAVEKRHDIIHRNGNDNSGKRVSVTRSDVESLIETVSLVLQGIDKQIKDGLLDEVENDLSKHEDEIASPRPSNI